jgi:formylglycine-generating enzyme required for sulfatase activity
VRVENYFYYYWCLPKDIKEIIMMSKLITVTVFLIIFSIDCSYILNDEAEKSGKPGAITLHQPEQVYPSAVYISWTEPETENFAAYKIFYSTSPGVTDSDIQVATIIFRNKTTFLIKELWGATTYYVKVFVYNSESFNESNEISFTTPSCTSGIFTDEQLNGMVRIPAGCFVGKDGSIGSITHDFFMDTTEVTDAEWHRVMHDSVVVSMFPKTEVSWFQSLLFCNKKSNLAGRDTCYTFSSIIIDSITSRISDLRDLTCDFTKNGFRLPTEDEWEYAYRAGGWEEYYWDKDGNTIMQFPWTTSYPSTLEDTLEMCDHAWWEYNNKDIGNWSSGKKEVARLKPNEWHLYDMAGNVQEFVWDISSDDRVQSRIDHTGPVKEPQGRTGRMIRGGRFDYNHLIMTAWWRIRHLEPDMDYKRDVGFRTVFTAM